MLKLSVFGAINYQYQMFDFEKRYNMKASMPAEKILTKLTEM